MPKRFFIILAVLAVLLSLLAGCSGGGQNSSAPDGENGGDSNPGGGDNKNNKTDTENTAAAVTTERIQPNLPDDINFSGEIFTFLVTGPSYGFGYYETKDIYAENQNGETLNDAVYMRNRNVEEKLNINIAAYKSDNVVSDARKTIQAGDDAYGAIFAQMFDNASMAQNSLLLNIKEIPHADLDKPWWDKNAENELSIKNKLYFTESDISTLARSCTLLMVFNKKLMKEYELGDPYEHVRNGSWTFDIYAKMVKSVYVDVNGNGEYDDGDIYGMWLVPHNPQYCLMGFGERMTTNDGAGIPRITWNTDRLYNAADKVWELFFDDGVCRSVDKMKPTNNFTNVYGYAREGLFANDQFLFFLGSPLIFEELRNMESDFGLLPMPKFDGSQPRYYSPVDQFGTIISVPASCTDTNKTGAVLEAMAAESMYTVRPAYYDTLLKRKYIRDDESEFVLDIIFSNRTYDLELLFNWGGLFGKMNEMTQKKNSNLVSEMEKIYARMEKAIAKTADNFE